MFDWLQGLPIWFQIVFSIGLLLTAAYTIVNGVRKGIEFGRGKFRIKVGESTAEAASTSPHANCPHVKDIMILINELTKFTSDKYSLQKTLVKQQMTFAEQKLSQIRMFYLKGYSDALKETYGTNTEDEKMKISYGIYKLILKDVEHYFLDLFRGSFKDNHFGDMTEQEFELFLTDKVTYYRLQFEELISDLYFYEPCIKKEELTTISQKMGSKVRDQINDIYRNARNVSVDYKVKLMELDETIGKVIQKYVG